MTEELREVLADEGMAEVQERFRSQYVAPENSLVITRELLGGDLDGARRTIGDHLVRSLGDAAERRTRKLAEAAARYAAELDGGSPAGGAAVGPSGDADS
jgi:hypothetical protein